jgi:hypothetical protein
MRKFAGLLCEAKDAIIDQVLVCTAAGICRNARWHAAALTDDWNSIGLPTGDRQITIQGFKGQKEPPALIEPRSNRDSVQPAMALLKKRSLQPMGYEIFRLCRDGGSSRLFASELLSRTPYITGSTKGVT